MRISQLKKSLHWFHRPILTTLLYLLAGGLWMLVSNYLLSNLVSDFQLFTFYVTVKGIGYVLLTGLYLFYLISKNRQWQRTTSESYKRRLEQTVQELSHYDRVTGLPNRAFLTQTLEGEVELALEEGTPLALLYLDIIHFNQINDSFGHEAGDQLLQTMVHRLQPLVPEGGLLARFTGVEFVMTLPKLSTEQAEWLAQQVLEAVTQHPFLLAGHEHYLSVSVGLSRYREDADDATALLRHADLAMNRAKEKGKNQVLFYTSETSRALTRRLALENGLRAALKHGEFTLNYQPKLEISTGRMIGMEALLRWQHPVLGTVSPAEFIPLAEETGLIVPIGEWVLRSACLQNKHWQEAGLPRMRVAVNLSIRQFETQNLVETVQSILLETGLTASDLELEITESIAIISADYVVNTLNRLKELGIKIAIDDFGTGYSSLAYLKHFSIDSLKIDQSFIRDLDQDSDGAIVRAISTMAHSLQLNIVAEGVEKPEQIDFLHAIGCHEAQGYWYSRPLSVEDFRKLLEQTA